jgi:hypothetical protein
MKAINVKNESLAAEEMEMSSFLFLVHCLPKLRLRFREVIKGT